MSFSNLVVRSDNLMLNYWLSATNSGCIGQMERPYFERWLVSTVPIILRVNVFLWRTVNITLDLMFKGFFQNK